MQPPPPSEDNSASNPAGQTVPLPVAGDPTTVEEVLAAFTALEQAFRQAKDRRAIFVGAYTVITAAMKQAIELGKFEDGEWVRRYLLGFARLYLAALRAYAAGEHERVPTAWRVAFELSSQGGGMVIQHLLLGINAHINNDLAIALADIGIDPDRPMRYDDHTGVNRVLQSATKELQDHVERFYSPALYLLDELCGSWDEDLAGLIVDRSREIAWQHCLALVEAADEPARDTTRRLIDAHSGALAEMIAYPYTTPIDLIEALRTAFRE